MSYIICRVELEENAKSGKPDYEELHAAMKQAGFEQWFKNSAGKKVTLPHATYCMTTNTQTAQAAKTKAKEAAESVWKEDMILIIAAKVDDIGNLSWFLRTEE